jgi:hypothetical protein
MLSWSLSCLGDGMEAQEYHNLKVCTYYDWLLKPWQSKLNHTMVTELFVISPESILMHWFMIYSGKDIFFCHWFLYGLCSLYAQIDHHLIHFVISTKEYLFARIDPLSQLITSFNRTSEWLHLAMDIATNFYVSMIQGPLKDWTEAYPDVGKSSNEVRQKILSD